MSNLFGMLWFLILLEDRIGGSAKYACMRRPPGKKAMKTTADMAWRRATIQEAGSEDEEEDEAQSMKWNEIWDGGGNGIRHISSRLFIPLLNTKKLIFW